MAIDFDALLFGCFELLKPDTFLNKALLDHVDVIAE